MNMPGGPNIGQIQSMQQHAAQSHDEGDAPPDVMSFIDILLAMLFFIKANNKKGLTGETAIGGFFSGLEATSFLGQPSHIFGMSKGAEEAFGRFFDLHKGNDAITSASGDSGSDSGSGGSSGGGGDFSSFNTSGTAQNIFAAHVNDNAPDYSTLPQARNIRAGKGSVSSDWLGNFSPESTPSMGALSSSMSVY
jgi:hypothetical protein